MIDTRAKRMSSFHETLPWMTLPDPDGSIDQADRQQNAWRYSGILAEAPEGDGNVLECFLSVAPVFFGRVDASAAIASEIELRPVFYVAFK